MMKTFRSVLALLCLVMLAQGARAAGPTVSNVRASQRACTQLVDIYYDLAETRTAAL